MVIYTNTPRLMRYRKLILELLLAAHCRDCTILTDFQIWEITKEKEQHYQVTYTVEQRITEGESSKTVRSAYQVTVYVDGSGNLTIIQNPTITSVPVNRTQYYYCQYCQIPA